MIRTVLYGGALSFFATACTGPETVADLSFDHSVALLTEQVRIDGTSEDLVSIGAVAVASDGAIAFTQVQDGAVRLYSADGIVVGSFGRQGDGPGEFQRPAALGWIADTLWVYDTQGRRVTYVTRSLQLLRTHSNVASTLRVVPEDAGRIPEFLRSFPAAVRQGESIYATLYPASGDGAIGFVSMDGTIEQILAYPPPGDVGQLRSPSGTSTVSLPIRNSSLTAVAPDANRVAVAMAALDGPDVGTFSLDVIDASGDTLVARRYPFVVELISKAVGDSAIAARAEMIRQMSPELADLLASEGTYPPMFPPIRSLMIGQDNTVWIEQRLREGSYPLYVIAPDGEPIGTLFNPQDRRIVSVTRESMWVVERNEVGIESLVRYGIEWPQ